MKIAILGTNGLLADSIGRYCSKCGYELNMYGLFAPQNHSYFSFTKVNLLTGFLDYTALKANDVIIYAVGAGIQSNLNEISDVIYSLNVEVPVNICSELKKNDYNGIFVTFGSYFEIGENVEDRKYTEEELLNSRLNVPNDYSASKRMLSRFISSFNGNFKMWHFILPTIYGENEAEHRLIPYILKSINNHTKLRFTSGEQIRQYIYIDEIPEILLRSFRLQLESGIYNIAGTETLSVKGLVSTLFDLMNAEIPEDAFGAICREDAGMKILALDGSKLYTKLNFQPSILIRDVYTKYHFDQ